MEFQLIWPKAQNNPRAKELYSVVEKTCDDICKILCKGLNSLTSKNPRHVIPLTICTVKIKACGKYLKGRLYVTINSIGVHTYSQLLKLI